MTNKLEKVGEAVLKFIESIRPVVLGAVTIVGTVIILGTMLNALL